MGCEWAAKLDACFERMVSNGKCDIPGVVALAYHKGQRYHKAFGFADKDTGQPMPLDAQFRIFSMTKVLASTVLLKLAEEYACTGGCESVDAFLDAEVADLVPSFKREFRIVSVVGSASRASEAGCAEPMESAADIVKYTSFLTGATYRLAYEMRPASRPLLVKHLMAEASGIGYDQWADIDLWLPNARLGLEYGAVQALRHQAGKGAYTSNCIIGQDASLEEYTDALAVAGVLVCEPGTFSYGLGALVVGRVVEVLYERLRGEARRFADVVTELLFEPLGMTSAAFYLSDGDPRAALVPVLYGGRMRDAADVDGSGGCDGLPYEQCLPAVPSLPNSVATDSFAGPRRCDSGDTGACMTVADYAKFYDMLLAGGTAPNGARLLSEESVHRLTHRAHDGLSRDSPIGRFMRLHDAMQSFNHGWATRPAAEGKPHCNFWSGYANNHGRLYVEDDAYVLVFPQFMGSSPGGWLLGSATVREPVTDVFEAML